MIKIDAILAPSRYRWGLWLAITWLIVLLLFCLPLLPRYRLILMLLVLASLWLAQVSRRHLLAMSTLAVKHPIHSSDHFGSVDELDWQLQWVQGYSKVPWGKASDIYIAKLAGTVDAGVVIGLNFVITAPLADKFSVEIWRDQVDNDTWQQLKILCR